MGWDKQLALDLLRQRGICRAVLEFSGGNDEGGVDDVHYYVPVKNDPDIRGALKLDAITETEVSLDPLDPEAQNLINACEESIYAQYSGFAGDFQVEGTVTFDVVAGTVVMEASESETVWKSLGAQEL